MRVFINPGHAPNGVPDPGAVGRLDGKLYRECDIVKEVSDGVAGYLNNVGIPCWVFQDDSLATICDKANKWCDENDLFISIHANAGGGEGTESYCYDFNSRGYLVAECIHKQIVASCNMLSHNGGVKAYEYYVLKNTVSPACLVELGYMDTESDLRKMLNNVDDFARAIARGVTDYIEGLGD